MPLRRSSDAPGTNLYTPGRIESLNSDCLKEINEGTQHGWLASQHETDNESKVSSHERKHYKEEEQKSKISIEENKAKHDETISEKDSMVYPTGFTFKRNYESVLNKHSIDESTVRNTEKKPAGRSRVFNPNKPLYKSIIAMTAAVVIQNFWRDFKQRKVDKTSDVEVGKSVLALLKKKIANNTTYINKKSNHASETSLNDTQKVEDKIEEHKDAVDALFDEVKGDMEDQQEKLSQSMNEHQLPSSGRKQGLIKPEVKEQAIVAGRKSLDVHRLSQKDTSELLKQNDINQIFEIQEKAIDYKETTQKAIMHKMLKQKKVSPNTYHKKKHSLEVWVNNEREKLQKQKNDVKNVFQNTIEIINNTNKNKDRIKQILNKSSSRRPGIWSDYSEGMNSFESNTTRIRGGNVSMNVFKHKRLQIASPESSLNSLMFSNDKRQIGENSVESLGSSIKDIKQSLKSKLKDYTSKQLEKANKEVEYDLAKEIKLQVQEPKTIELIENVKPKQKSPSGVGIESPEGQVETETPDRRDLEESKTPERSIVDYINQKFEKDLGGIKDSRARKQPVQSYPSYEQTLDRKIELLGTSNSSFSPETPKEHLEKSENDLNLSEEAKQISIKDVSSVPIKKTSAIDDLNIQSKWLENYLKKETGKSSESVKSDVEIEKVDPNFQVIYDEEDSGTHTPEGVVDVPISGQILANQVVPKEKEYSAPVSPKLPESDEESEEDDNHEIPVIAYSDEDRSQQTTDRIRKEESRFEDDSGIVSDSNDEFNLKNSDLITASAPPLKESPALQKEKQTDLITNDLFYEILADIITDPIPRRDLSIFALQPQSNRRFMVDPIKRKNFELFAIEKYLEEVIENIMENESGFIDNLLEPVRRNPLDMLQLLQNSDLGSYEHFENIALKQPVLNLDLYLDIERNKEEKRLTEAANRKIIKHLETSNDNQESGTDDDEAQVEFEQIHRKMLFDCINESINKYRPYGEEGVPMPWTSSTRRLCSNDILNFEKVFNGIKDSLFKWASARSGVMPSSEY